MAAAPEEEAGRRVRPLRRDTGFSNSCPDLFAGVFYPQRRVGHIFRIDRDDVLGSMASLAVALANFRPPILLSFA
jgi:hypothetical protein